MLDGLSGCPLAAVHFAGEALSVRRRTWPVVWARVVPPLPTPMLTRRHDCATSREVRGCRTIELLGGEQVEGRSRPHAQSAAGSVPGQG